MVNFKQDNGVLFEGALCTSPWIVEDLKDWDNIIRDAKITTYKKGTVVYRQSEPPKCLYLVKEGRVALETISAEGRKRCLFIADRGTCFGELSSIDGLNYHCSATTTTSTDLYIVTRERLLFEIKTNPDFCLSILKTMSRKTRILANLVDQMTFDDAGARICHSIMSLMQQYGKRTKDNTIKLEIKFTHQEMADQTGLSRVCVSNIFSELLSEGIIGKDNGYLVVHDLAKLQKHLSRKM